MAKTKEGFITRRIDRPAYIDPMERARQVEGNADDLRRLIGEDLPVFAKIAHPIGERWEIPTHVTGEQAAILFAAVDRLQHIATPTGYYLRTDQE